MISSQPRLTISLCWLSHRFFNTHSGTICLRHITCPAAALWYSRIRIQTRSSAKGERAPIYLIFVWLQLISHWNIWSRKFVCCQTWTEIHEKAPPSIPQKHWIKTPLFFQSNQIKNPIDWIKLLDHFLSFFFSSPLFHLIPSPAPHPPTPPLHPSPPQLPFPLSHQQEDNWSIMLIEESGQLAHHSRCANLHSLR